MQPVDNIQYTAHGIGDKFSAILLSMVRDGADQFDDAIAHRNFDMGGVDIGIVAEPIANLLAQ